MKSLLLSACLFALTLGSAQAQNTPWPGQCPAGALPTTVGCQPQAATPQATDLLLGWQVGQTPSTRSFQLQQLHGAGYFQATDFGVKADGVTSDDVALKAAFDACAAKGGKLLLPPGNILLTGAAGPITVQDCGVEGTGTVAGRTQSTASRGTMILLTSTTVKPFIAGHSWSWSGTNFFWPNQTTGLIVYPPLLNVDVNGCKWRFNNNVVVNAYDFVSDTIQTSPIICQGDWHIHNNIIYAMRYGISSTGQGDTIFINENQFSPGPWFSLDTVNSPSAWLNARANNWAFHVERTVGFGWNTIAKNNAFFAWRGGFLIDNTGFVGISDVDMTTDFVSTLIDTSSGGVWAVGNGFSIQGNCNYFGTGHAPPCFNLGAGSALEVKRSTLSSYGSLVETSGSNISLQNVTVGGIGGQNDGTEYYIVHFTGGSGGEQIIIQDSTTQGSNLSNKTHTHGIKTDVTAARVIIQNNRMNFLNDIIDMQPAGTSTITGNWSINTWGPASVIITGGGGIQYANNNFDKGPNATLSNCGGDTVAFGGFSGFFVMGRTTPTSTCTLTFPFSLLGSGGGGCNFQPSSNVNLWANVSGLPAVWVIQSSAPLSAQNVFFNCRAAQ